jgi:hypothetical protein
MSLLIGIDMVLNVHAPLIFSVYKNDKTKNGLLVYSCFNSFCSTARFRASRLTCGTTRSVSSTHYCCEAE